jgi:GGDEF domain-containing protein
VSRNVLLVGAARAMSLRMSYLAQHAFLTELPNRLLLNDRLTQAIALAHRHGKIARTAIPGCGSLQAHQATRSRLPTA